MTGPQNQVELATAFQAETDTLVALDARIARLIRERRRLATEFDAIAAATDTMLVPGEAPLALLDELDRIGGEIERIEHELEKILTVAIGRFR